MRNMIIENGELTRYEGKGSHITVPAGVQRIGCRAFSRCNSIQNIHLPEGLTSIGIGAFEQCKSLKSVLLPLSVATIDDQPFAGCDMLEKIEVDPGNKSFRSIDGALFNYDGTTLFRYPLAKNDPEYAVPDGVQVIADGAFKGCANLETLSLPDSVTELGYEVFCYCDNLHTVKLPNSITVISSFAFSDCCNLCFIALPENLKKIEEGAFSGTGLKYIQIPDTVEEIEFDAFADCLALDDIKAGPNTQVDPYELHIYGDD